MMIWGSNQTSAQAQAITPNDEFEKPLTPTNQL
jgi:hypothetical protein